MNCPICQVQLISIRRQDVSLRYCPNCHGVWLSQQEANKIIHLTSHTKRPYDPQYLSRFLKQHPSHELDGYSNHYPTQAPMIKRAKRTRHTRDGL